jgi:hypothetical protein
MFFKILPKHFPFLTEKNLILSLLNVGFDYGWLVFEVGKVERRQKMRIRDAGHARNWL